ncbi:acyltransferase [Sporocytophaga myxococcoides]|uniref:acyltransferase n=1 Tax=Sporocytophaga myxococcoides TaxID=153721 RepID=UPI000490FCCD|nr:acyltransferase [Sporocytophaga myxococcoides]
MSKLFDKVIFRFRERSTYIANIFRKLKWRFYGMEFGANVSCSTIFVTWPHQVKIGNNCNLEHGIFFKYDGIWEQGPSIILGDNIFVGKDVEFNIKERIEISNSTLIGSNSKFIDHDHGINLGLLIGDQQCPAASISIGQGVWIGANVVILKGVSIGDGAVIAAGAIVNKSVPSNEIWGGVPAHKIGIRK